MGRLHPILCSCQRNGAHNIHLAHLCAGHLALLCRLVSNAEQDVADARAICLTQRAPRRCLDDMCKSICSDQRKELNNTSRIIEFAAGTQTSLNSHFLSTSIRSMDGHNVTNVISVLTTSDRRVGSVLKEAPPLSCWLPFRANRTSYCRS